MYFNGVQSYKKTNITTSDPLKLIIICYEGIIDCLKLAKEKIEEKDYEKKTKAVQKAQDIIEELMCSLDLEKGGEVAKNLESLYNYMLRRIFHGDTTKDVGAIDEVIGIFSDLLLAWKEVASMPESQVQLAQVSLSQKKRSADSGYITA